MSWIVWLIVGIIFGLMIGAKKNDTYDYTTYGGEKHDSEGKGR